MPAEGKITVYQDLLIQGRSRNDVRRELIAGASTPWRHSQARDDDAADYLGAGEDVILFEREQRDGIEAVGLTLYSEDSGYKVANIVPTKARELSRLEYNSALMDFAERIVRPAMGKAGMTVEVSSPTQGLSDWLPVDAAEALRRFSAIANKTTGSSHPSDRRRWMTFLHTAHKNRSKFDALLLSRWLVEIEHWPEEVASQLASEYEFAMDLLDHRVSS